MAYSSCNQITFLHVSHMYRREGESNPGLTAVDREYYPLHHAPTEAIFYESWDDKEFENFKALANQNSALKLAILRR